jgi:hypothetical protein
MSSHRSKKNKKKHTHKRKTLKAKGLFSTSNYVKLRPAHKTGSNKYVRSGNTFWSDKYHIHKADKNYLLQGGISADNPLILTTSNAQGKNMYITKIHHIQDVSWSQLNFYIDYYYATKEMSNPNIQTGAWQCSVSNNKLKKLIKQINKRTFSRSYSGYIKLRGAHKDPSGKYTRSGNVFWSAKYYLYDVHREGISISTPLVFEPKNGGNNLYITNILDFNDVSSTRFNFQITYYFANKENPNATSKTGAWQCIVSSKKVKKMIKNLNVGINNFHQGIDYNNIPPQIARPVLQRHPSTNSQNLSQNLTPKHKSYHMKYMTPEMQKLMKKKRYTSKNVRYGTPNMHKS